MTEDEAIDRAARARVGRIATVRRDGTPHVVPLVFALVRLAHRAPTLYWAVDRKPKRSAALRRLENLRGTPAAEVLVDGFDEDWSRLWWVRLRGSGRVVDSSEERARAVDALRAKYPQYRRDPLDREIVAIDVRDVRWWTASASA